MQNILEDELADAVEELENDPSIINESIREISTDNDAHLLVAVTEDGGLVLHIAPEHSDTGSTAIVGLSGERDIHDLHDFWKEFKQLKGV